MLSCLALAASSLLCVPPRSTTPPTPAATYIGRENQLQVRIPRVEGEVAVAEIDGALTEPAWSQAALLTGFSQFAPLDGIPAADSTQVLIWYSPTAMYVGIRAFEAHGSVHATLADRDKITADDNVQLLLGTFHDRRQAYVFAVNPFGVQMDGTIVEAGAATGGWTPTLSGRTAPDLSQDFVFTSKGRLTEYGYEVEIRIPFKSLKYQSVDVQSWDINVVRQVQHSGYEDSWAPASGRTRRSSPRRARSTDCAASIAGSCSTSIQSRRARRPARPSPNGWGYTHPRPQIGGNVRWGMTNNLTLNGTVNPDFAEVESDAGQFVIDPRQSLFFPEKRPFFLEGLEQFNAPHNLIYTRRVAKPDGAIKLTGKVAGTSVGFLSASDNQSLSANGQYDTYYNILRAQRDVGRRVADRHGVHRSRGWRRLQSRGRRRRPHRVRRRVLGIVPVRPSYDKTRDAMTNAPLWEGILARNGKRFGFRYTMTGIDEQFRTLSGFISRPGIAHGAIDHRATWFNAARQSARDADRRHPVRRHLAVLASHASR